MSNLNKDEKKYLADMALMSAMGKVQVLSQVSSHLEAAIGNLRSLQKVWNEFARDSELIKIREDIEKLYYKIPSGWSYAEEVMSAIGVESEVYDYEQPGYDLELLVKEAGTPYDQDNDDWDFEREKMLPFEDPIKVYKRNK